MAEMPGEIPEWAAEPFERFLDFQEDVGRTGHLATAGISMITAVPAAVHALGKANDEPPERHVQRLARARRDAEAAKREVENDFPLLHSMLLVAIWSALESMARAVVTAWIANKRECIQPKRLERLKVPFLEYEALSQAERPHYIAELLEREVDAPLKAGVNRFEELLAFVGLDGQVDENCARALFEMGQIRNVIVHRGGRADRRFVDACPWLDVAVGARVQVREENMRRYMGAAAGYALECIQRTRLKLGLPRANIVTKARGPGDASTPPEPTEA